MPDLQLDTRLKANIESNWKSITTLHALKIYINSWAAGDWWRRPGMFEHLRFCSNGFSVVVQRFNSLLLHDGFIDDDRPE